MYAGLTKEEELSFDLGEKLTPQVDWHGQGTTAEDPNEMILEGLNSLLCYVALMLLRGDEFVGHARSLDGDLVLRGCLVVEDLMLGDGPVALHWC
jgi:hypothetical protein